MKKFTKVQIDSAIKNAVKAILVDGKEENTITESLYKDGYMQWEDLKTFPAMMKKIGLKEGYILSDADIVKKVKDFLQSHPVAHSLEVVAIAEKLKLPQLDETEKQAYIIANCGATSKQLKVSSKFTKLYETSKIHGRIAEYIIDNPDYTPSSLIKACKGMGESEATKTDDYVNEFLAYREFFESLNTEA